MNSSHSRGPDAAVLLGRGLTVAALLGAGVLLHGCAGQPPTPASTSGGGVTQSASASPTASTVPTRVAPSATITQTFDLRGTNMGLMRGFDATTGVLSIDVVYFLTGKEAVAYLAERASLWKYLDCDAGNYSGGSTAGCSLPNDYWVVNENPRLRSLPLAPDAVIELIPWPRCCEPVATDRVELAVRAGAEQPLLISFDVNKGGLITAVTEVYTP